VKTRDSGVSGDNGGIRDAGETSFDEFQMMM